MTQLLKSRAAALSFPLSNVLARYQKETGVSDEQACLHEPELKRYLYICARYPHSGWPMVTTIDELWHTFIIFTKEYHAFCQALGAPYIHHQPFVDGERIDRQLLERQYQQFLTIYRHELGESPAEVWSMKLDSECADGDSCDTCGGHCR